jgi:hypothetical protein
MAKVEFTPSISAVRGRVGRYTFRKMKNGKSVVSAGPTYEGKRRKASSTEQQGTRDNFAEGGRYAKQVLSDPLAARMYKRLAEASGIPVRSLLIGDFLTPPTVEHIELGSFRGRVGDAVKVLAVDDVEVVGVDVIIRDTAGSICEQGAAKKTHDVWTYLTTTAVAAGQAVMIEAVARDRPGHEGRASQLWAAVAAPKPEASQT